MLIIERVFSRSDSEMFVGTISVDNLKVEL